MFFNFLEDIEKRCIAFIKVNHHNRSVNFIVCQGDPPSILFSYHIE